jgi:hypothetical protein
MSELVKLFCHDALVAVMAGIVVIPGCLVILGIRLWRKIDRGKVVRYWTTLTILSFIVLLYYVPFPFSLSAVHEFGFSFYAKRTFDVSGIAAWTKTYRIPPDVDEMHEQWEYSVVPPEALPESLRAMAAESWDKNKLRYRGTGRLGPSFLFHKKERTLNIGYGSGMMGKWSLIVGSGVGRNGYGISVSEDAYVYERE